MTTPSPPNLSEDLSTGSLSTSASAEFKGGLSVTVKCPTYADIADIQLQVSTSATVRELKEKIFREHPKKPLVTQQLLIHAGKVLQNSIELSSIQTNGGTLITHLVVRKPEISQQTKAEGKKPADEPREPPSQPSVQARESSLSNSSPQSATVQFNQQLPDLNILNAAQLNGLQGRIVYIDGLPYLAVQNNSRDSSSASNTGAVQAQPQPRRIHAFTLQIPSLSNLMSLAFSLLKTFIILRLLLPADARSPVFYIGLVFYVLFRFEFAQRFVRQATERVHAGTVALAERSALIDFRNIPLLHILVPFAASLVPGLDEYLTRQAQVEEQQQVPEAAHDQIHEEVTHEASQQEVVPAQESTDDQVLPQINEQAHATATNSPDELRRRNVQQQQQEQ